MAPNQPSWPREWLMTDERMGDRLWDAVEALPEGAGIVFRHYACSKRERAMLGRRLADHCRNRGLTLAVAADVQLAITLEAAVHNPVDDPGMLAVSRSAHSRAEALTACQSEASLIFLSPIRPTRSHPDRAAIPRDEARRIVAACRIPVIALGGMNRARFDDRKCDGFYGWAGIDAWLSST